MLVNTNKPAPNNNSLISSFTGQYYFLSNFYKSPVFFRNRFFPSSEHAYQSMKCDDPPYKEAINSTKAPREARRLGKLCHLREDWDEIKIDIMREVLVAKFKLRELKGCLLITGKAQLIEGNSWGDRFWGCEWENGKWVGQNNLGLLLMELREQLRKDKAT